MKNIIRIARNDIHNIRKNVIALIVIFGITIVPSLYAWFNIAASWDPYKNTGNLKVAVASLDKGYDGELLPVRLNLGNDIISSLRENTQLHWIFTDAKDASNGVRSGKYYASVVISETFSKDMMSLFSSETTHPTITYCINEKENAIAPKVTEKGADAIRQEINETFTETISKTALDAFRFVADVSAEKGDASLAENLSASLAEISADLDSASGTVQAFSDMTDAASLMLDTTSVIFSHTGDGTKTSLGALTDAGTGLLLFLPLYPAQLTQSVRHYLTEKLIIHPSLPRSKPHLTPTVQMRMPLSLPLMQSQTGYKLSSTDIHLLRTL